MPALAGFVAGVIALQQLAALPAPAILAAGAALAAALAALAVLVRRRGRAASLALATLAAVLAGFGYAGASARLRLADELAFSDEGRDARVRGVVATLPLEFEGASRFTFDVEDVLDGGFHVPRRIVLTWYRMPNAVVPAQRWDLTVRLRRPQATFNPGGFDAEAWMLEQGVRAVGTVRASARDAPARLVDERVLQWNACIDRVRARLRDQLERELQGRRYGSVIVALVMGDQSLIGEDDWALFNRTGISHLVSISGLHITMIAALAALAARLAWRRSTTLLRCCGLPVVGSVAAIGGGLAYCLLAGWGVPAQRTLLMLSVVALAQCARTRLAPGTVLAGAAALVCLWDPWAVLAAGFWLSFGAVGCIFLAADGRLAQEGWRSAAREALRMQGAITIGQVPLTIAIFGQVSVVAPLANAIAIPLVSYAVAPLALIGAALCSVPAGAVAGALLLHAAEAVFGALAQALHWLTAPSWSWLALPMPPTWTVAAGAVGSAWLVAPAGWPARCAGICWLLPMFVWPVPEPARGELWVTALDVGQGMSLVLETADRVVVFDTGPRYSPQADAGDRVLVPYLRSRGIRRVDAVFVSHQDIDHAGGVTTLLRSISVGQVWTSIDPGNRLIEGAADVERCVAGRSIELGALRLEVLAPPASVYDNQHATSNAHSCVVLAQMERQRVLLTGDIPARQEREMLQEHGDVAAALLVAPHHGSHSSSSEELITSVHPRWVSMQLGYRNRFGHPHAEVVERYRAHDVQIVRSDEAGAAQWRFAADGKVELERWRIDHPRYWHNQPERRAMRAPPGDDGDETR